MNAPKWPKVLAELTPDQKRISDDFMKYWHEVLPKRYGLIERFNHSYPILHAPARFTSTIEIGAGLAEHLEYEKLSAAQEAGYVALELRSNMVEAIRARFPRIQALESDCQGRLPFDNGCFDRILAIHVLEHLPNLPAAVREMHRLSNPQGGVLSIVIPCEGGLAYSIARKISAERIFKKRYRQPYGWFIEREHINRPREILEELAPYFETKHRSFFPFPFIPVESANLCIGLTLARR
jgi:SAM-dependent methyltransferase